MEFGRHPFPYPSLLRTNMLPPALGSQVSFPALGISALGISAAEQNAVMVTALELGARSTYNLKSRQNLLGDGRPDRSRPPVVVDVGGNIGLTR